MIEDGSVEGWHLQAWDIGPVAWTGDAIPLLSVFECCEASGVMSTTLGAGGFTPLEASAAGVRRCARRAGALPAARAAGADAGRT